MKKNVIIVDPLTINKPFQTLYVGCLILTGKGKILLQQRPEHFMSYPGYVCEFGGKIKKDESPNDALIRELNEELGAQLNIKDVMSFGAITELTSNHGELIHTFFWHDKFDSITGCYEGKPRHFDNATEIFALPRITDGLRWLLVQCQHKGLIK